MLCTVRTMYKNSCQRRETNRNMSPFEKEKKRRLQMHVTAYREDKQVGIKQNFHSHEIIFTFSLKFLPKIYENGENCSENSGDN